MSRLLMLLCFGAVGVPCGMMRADVINVLNAGFESPVRLDAAYGPADHWTEGHYDVTNPGTWIVEGLDGGGNWNPDAVDGFTGGAAFAGDHVGWATAEIDTDAGLSQILAEPLRTNTEYVLEVQVGNSFYNAGDTADYRLELLAGGVLLASATGGSPLTDTWQAQSLTYVSGSGHPQLGEPLEIRLIAVEYPRSDDHEVEFDEVSLTAFPATPLVIREIIHQPGSDTVTLTWTSRPGASYAVRGSTDLADWEANLADGVEADPGETTTRSFGLGELAGDGGAVFLRIEQL